MTETPSSPQSLERSFRDLSDAEAADIAKAAAFTSGGWTGSFGWDELLQSQRVLIISEAGAGKTYECQAQQAKLGKAGEAAFFLDLATLAVSSVRDMLGGYGEEERLDAWLRSQSEIATFFLDSIDELKITLGKFDQALKRLNKALEGQLGRARIIITTRPVPIDRELIVRHLPLPVPGEAQPTAKAFADMMMDRTKNVRMDKAGPPPWRTVRLMPLSRQQIRDFAVLQGVADPDALLADIRQRDAEEFAERPQDLIELCSDWREHHHIRTHRDQVETNIETKLKPNAERRERAELSQQVAINGASQLALAAMLTRKLTLRYSAETDTIHASEAALDTSKLLLSWGAEARATLLERPLFGFASYGRVRFHHRSVLEYLAAKQLDILLARGISIKSIKRLLFTETAQGARTVRPSMRPVAAWLALSRNTIFDDVVATDPAVVLNHGDPQSLRPAQRVRALEAYVDRYGSGGWRGLSTPRIQVHRFASSELTESLKRLWARGVENPEVRELLVLIVAIGKLTGCADIAYAVAMDMRGTIRERSLAIEALSRLNDPRLAALSVSIETESARWPDVIARRAILELLPTHMPIGRLSRILRRVKERPDGAGDLTYRLPLAIEGLNLSPEYLNQLREALTNLIIDGIKWDGNKFPHLRTKRPELIAPLSAVCRRQAAQGVRSKPWINSSLLVIRLSKEGYSAKDALSELRRALAELPPDAREIAFWTEDAFLVNLHQSKDMWHRVFDLSRYGGIQLNDKKDAAWVRKRLSDPKESLEHREIMLWVEMLQLNRGATDYQELLESLRSLVLDAPTLATIIDGRLKVQDASEDLRRMEAESAKRAKLDEQRAAKAHSSWVEFWSEIVQDPEAVFAEDRAQNTAWNLWRAVERSGQESRASGWSRRFIEERFGKAVADRLRETMMTAWRSDKPTLRSERPDGQKDTFLVKWQFGLAGISAEAEDSNWAKRLTEQEAGLACRYAPIELNGFPSWFESLAIEHPSVVDHVLGKELDLSLREMTGTNYPIFLQNISHASPIIAALFVPRIRAWLLEAPRVGTLANHTKSEQELRQAIEILVKSGSDDERRLIEEIARERLADGLPGIFKNVWLSALLHLNPFDGVEAVERRLKDSVASKTGAGVHLFATLFNRDYGSIGVNLRAPEFTPPLLLRLLSVRPEAF